AHAGGSEVSGQAAAGDGFGEPGGGRREGRADVDRVVPGGGADVPVPLGDVEVAGGVGGAPDDHGAGGGDGERHGGGGVRVELPAPVHAVGEEGHHVLAGAGVPAPDDGAARIGVGGGRAADVVLLGADDDEAVVADGVGVAGAAAPGVGGGAEGS